MATIAKTTIALLPGVIRIMKNDNDHRQLMRILEREHREMRLTEAACQNTPLQLFLANMVNSEALPKDAVY